MPRRPRPSTRPPPGKSDAPRKQAKLFVPQPKPKAVPKITHFAETDSESGNENEDEDEDAQESSEEEDGSLDQEEFEEGSSQGSGIEDDYGQDDDADAPRVAQWEDDEEEDLLHKESIEEKPAPEVSNEVCICSLLN